MSQINVDTIRSRTGTAPQLDKGVEVTVGYGITGAGGVNVSGALTCGNITGADATFSGTLTYEDVTNIDAVGFATFQKGVNITGVCTAASYEGDGSALTNITSGVDLRYDGNTVGSAITAINFSGFSSVTAPTAGLSTVTAAWGQEDAWLFGG